MINQIIKNRRVLIFMIVFTFMTIVSLFFYFKTNPNFLDFKGNWVCCGYVIHGINPLKYIGKSVVTELGTVPYGFGNLPYGLLLGNLFYFGFFSLPLAKVCFIIMSIIVFLIMIHFSFKFFELRYVFLLLSLFSINIIASIRCGNIGHIVCMLVLLTIFTMDSHKVLSGIFLAFAMVKPQITFPFCITMLLCKKFMPLFIAALIDVLASFVAALLTHENVIDMFVDFFNAKVGSNTTSYGILTFLYKNDFYSALMPSMIFGLVLLVIFTFLVLKTNDSLIIFSIPAIICSIWSYSWSSDHFILIIPTMAFIMLFDKLNFKHYVFSIFIALFYSFILSVQHIIRNSQIIKSFIYSLFGIGGNIGISLLIDFILLISLVALLELYKNSEYNIH